GELPKFVLSIHCIKRVNQNLITIISNTEDNSSTSACVFLFGGGVISWASKKQTCITGSTMKSEFVALAAAGAIGLDHNGSSRSKFFNHSASLPAAAKATNSDSIVEPVLQFCFLEAQEITPPPNRNTQALVDELSSVLLIMVIRF
nr:zinc finger, CCHC-type [Tanacetum cinerariifolium]